MKRFLEIFIDVYLGVLQKQTIFNVYVMFPSLLKQAIPEVYENRSVKKYSISGVL